MLLTETEIHTALNSVSACVQDRDILYSRAIESAVLAKLREQEPVAWRKLLCFENGAHEYKFSHTNVLKDGEPLYLSPAPIPEGYALKSEIESLRISYDAACMLVAQMHEAVMGEVVGPHYGVVEDVRNKVAEYKLAAARSGE